MENLETNEATLNQLRDAFAETSFEGAGFPHQTYRRDFNLVDMHNRYFYKYRSPHKNRDWLKQYLLGILDSAIINVWSLASKHGHLKLGLFKTRLSALLLNATADDLTPQNLTP